ncbi:MAG TPA: YkgJ family cysteine cluster protein [Methanomicrobia archaeon]|nr:YkgJ family cysteine cluster protein [Methanomicrobia archaeon]
MKEKLVPLKDQRFKCQLCGECCRNRWVPLTLGDISRIKNVKDDFLLVWNEKKLVIERREWNNGCIFLKDNLCEINKIKPLICRLYPVALSEVPVLKNDIPYRLKNGKKVFLYLDKSCKGIGRGKKFDIKKILDLCEIILQESKETSLEKLIEII